MIVCVGETKDGSMVTVLVGLTAEDLMNMCLGHIHGMVELGEGRPPVNVELGLITSEDVGLLSFIEAGYVNSDTVITDRRRES